LTVEQLEAARAERMRQNGHGAITLEDVRTWIEETGLCIFLPRSAQAGFTAPTFVEAVAGQRTTEPTLELIATAENLLVRLEADGVAVRLNLAGQPGDQPDYVVAGWVLPYIYALRGDRDWRRSPQLTGSRQVSQLAVQAAKQLESANMTAAQIRDALGREVTETAVLRALHELWKQLRIIPVVPEVGHPALWQPLRQRFQKAIAEGASTSQVTAISVLASIYLQAVIAGSMEDVELFLSPLTSRSKIREVVRGLAATRQVHSTTMGHSPMFYVAGTLPEFPVPLNFQINSSFQKYPGQVQDEDDVEPVEVFSAKSGVDRIEKSISDTIVPAAEVAAPNIPEASASIAHDHVPQAPSVQRPAARAIVRPTPTNSQSSAKTPAPRPRPSRNAGATHPRERNHSGSGSHESRSSSPADRRRAPAARGTSSTANGSRNNAARPTSSRPASGRNGSLSNSNGSNSRFAKPANGSNGSGHGKPAPAQRSNGGPSRPATSNSPSNGARNGSVARTGVRPTSRPGSEGSSRTAPRSANGKPAVARNDARPGSTNPRPRSAADGTSRKPAASGAKASAAKRYSFSGQAKQAPKPAAKAGSKPAGKSHSAPRSGSTSRPAATKRRG
jgi:hypothetical protein